VPFLGRDPDYMKIINEFSVQVIKNGMMIGLFPELLRPYVFMSFWLMIYENNLVSRFVSRFFRNIPKSIDQALKHLGPIIQDRLDKDAKYGTDWEGRPVGFKLVSFNATN
jgi:hypothetical protein